LDAARKIKRVLQRLLPLFSLCGFFLSGLCANVTFWKMMAEVNLQLSDDQKFSWWWWTPSKYLRFWKAHKHLCAGSPWRIRFVLSYAAAFVFMLLLAASFPVSPR
jgi:hypothetical protein